MSTVPPLKSRQPTGEMAYPLILVEGEHKKGKTALALLLSNSKLVGRTFVAEMGEACVDEYAEVGPFEILEHNGTWSDFFGQVRAATAVPTIDDKPNVIIVDTGSSVWNLLSRWANERAKAADLRKKDRNGNSLSVLKEDPDGEVTVGHSLWTSSTDRWYELIDLFRSWPGIAIITTRAGQVSKFEGGKPVANQTIWTVECQKSTPFEVNAVVRANWPEPPRLMAVRKWAGPEVPSQGMPLRKEDALEQVVFEILGAGAQFAARSRNKPSVGITVNAAKNGLVNRLTPKLGETDAKTKAAELWKDAGYKDLAATDELNDEQWTALVATADATEATTTEDTTEKDQA